MHGSQVLAIVPKKTSVKGTWKGPSKLTQGPFLCYYIITKHYGRRLYATYLFSTLKRIWWSNSIIVACISINWQYCGHTFYHLQPKAVWSPIETWWVYRLLQPVTSWFTALRQNYNCLSAKYCCLALWLWNVAHKWSLKDLTTMERAPWQAKRTPGLNQRTWKAFYWKSTFQGLQWT